ncbi:hypothetical protein F2Q69_00012911 [Brassica cretica]|uniref:Uncharacterized protein n=1 Tax=Brassica cretica TaxID=69181 RepID=A0A8S9R0T9_BRACR|nr:hypothetical protein F2Q69_00012911 [Brassica cretica]
MLSGDRQTSPPFVFFLLLLRLSFVVLFVSLLRFLQFVYGSSRVSDSATQVLECGGSGGPLAAFGVLLRSGTGAPVVGTCSQLQVDAKIL